MTAQLLGGIVVERIELAACRLKAPVKCEDANLRPKELAAMCGTDDRCHGPSLPLFSSITCAEREALQRDDNHRCLDLWRSG